MFNFLPKKARIPAICFLIVMSFVAFTVAFAHSKYQKTQINAESIDEEQIYTNETQPVEEIQPEITDENRKASRKPVKKQNTQKENKNIVEFMLYGVDARDNKTLTKGTNSDTNIICQVNLDTGEIKLISVLRDTYVESPNGSHNKINGIYCKYGIQEALGTINKCTDLKITKYVSVNWKSVATAIDRIGGIDLELSGAEINNLNQQIIETSKVTGLPAIPLENKGRGMYHLNGVQTVGHARDRQVGQYDVERTHRQREIISAAIEAAKNYSVFELNEICDELLPGIATNFSFEEISAFIPLITKYHITVTECFPFQYIMQNGKQWYIYPDTLVTNVAILHSLLYGTNDYQPSEGVRNVSAYVSGYAETHR